MKAIALFTIVLAGMVLSGCDDVKYRNDRTLVRVCPGGVIIWKWRGKYYQGELPRNPIKAPLSEIC